MMNEWKVDHDTMPCPGPTPEKENKHWGFGSTWFRYTHNYHFRDWISKSPSGPRERVTAHPSMTHPPRAVTRMGRGWDGHTMEYFPRNVSGAIHNTVPFTASQRATSPLAIDGRLDPCQL